MATEPKIEVKEQSVSVVNNTPGMAGRIAVIGAFNSTITDVTVASTDTSAHANFGTTTTVGTFKGTDAIDFLFIGASELLIVNTTTWSDEDTPVASTTLTNEKLTAALAKLKNEAFDLLFIADELTDAAQTIVTTWLNNEAKAKFGHDQVIQLQKATAAAYTTSAATIDKQIAFVITQQLGYNGTLLSLNQSAALMAGVIASMQVNRSLTAKVIPGVTSVSPEYTFETGDLGAKLMELNIPIIKCRNRRLNQYICMNSMLPNSLDMAINRTRDYIINRLEAEVLLGESSGDATIEAAEMIVETVREECVEQLNLLEDIVYSINKVSSSKIQIILEKLIFNGIITDIEIDYSIEVQ